MTQNRLWLQLAIRNLISHRVKTLIVGAIMTVGTVIVLLGTALLGSIEASMEKVVTASLTGQFQVASDKGRDPLSLFGGLTASLPDLGEIEDFGPVKTTLEGVPNVKAVIPMGIGLVTGSSGNDIDEVLLGLRKAVESGDATAQDAHIATLKQISATLEREVDSRALISSDTTAQARDRATLDRVLAADFWEGLRTAPNDTLLFLDTELAPMGENGRRFFLRTLGTDPGAFQENFDRFQIEKGQMIPPLQRGLLISRRSHERFLKHQIARQFDAIKRQVDEQGEDLAEDEALGAQVRRMSRQYRSLSFQLDPQEVAELTPLLVSAKGMPEAAKGMTFDALLQAFLLVDAQSFASRYDLFYKEVAPRIELYRVNVGDEVTLQSFTRRGYVKSIRVKVWGTFSFKGIEESDLAGVVNILDLVTFRETVGQMTDAQRAELETIREEVGAQKIDRKGAEDALFGQGADLVEEVEGVALPAITLRGPQAAGSGSYAQEELDSGLAIHAAIVLEDPKKREATAKALQVAIKTNALGLKLVGWQEAAGIVGQLIMVIRIVLIIAIVIIFLVALVIMNNSMVMATVDRVAEIGTMRAIGAQRGLILKLFVMETLLLGAIAGALGTTLGLGVLWVLGEVGIPARNEIVRFLFAGPRLYPTFEWWNVGLALCMTLGISLMSTVYPALLAASIQPVVAMRGRE